MLEDADLIVDEESRIPEMFDEIREGLGTSEMSLDQMIAEMRKIREASDYEHGSQATLNGCA